MRIVVAMSGGVDSSVAAALLAEQGHDVIGLSMQLYDQRGTQSFGNCCTLDDLHDARRVAAAGRAVSRFSSRCMRSWVPLYCGLAGGMR